MKGWRDRAHDLLMAGGALALGGCLQGQGCCNANPDPCCWANMDNATAFTKMECSQEQACRADGGRYTPGYVSSVAPDAAVVPGRCDFPDGGADGSAGDGGGD